MATTKHERVRKALLKLIESGTFPPGAQLPAETDLPRRLRASKITVVRALNDLAREGVIIRRRGSGSFVADPNSKPLIPGRFLRIALLLPHPALPDFGYGPMMKKMTDGVLATFGMADVFPHFPKVNPDVMTRGQWVSETKGCVVDVLGEAYAVRHRHPPLKEIVDASYDGFMSLGVADDAWLLDLVALGKPTVIVDHPSDALSASADHVFFDAGPSYRSVVREMTRKGMKRIHFLGCWLHKPYERLEDQARDKEQFHPSRGFPSSDSVIRMSAWMQAMHEAGLRPPPEWVHFSWSHADACEEAAREWTRLPKDELPEAVVCHNYSQAVGVAAAFKKQGLSIVGAGSAEKGDELVYGNEVRPIFADYRYLGATAASVLLWRIREPQRSLVRVGVPTTLS